MRLFPREHVVGIFRGFSEGGMEFHADLVLPYRVEFQAAPMHGQFVVVQLETENEGVLGRITSISSQGRLASGAGEDYGVRAMREGRVIPEDLREQYLKYQIDIRVLGVLRLIEGRLVFVASHRRLPHVGSPVSLVTDELLREIGGHNDEGAELGHLALGEFVYADGDARLIAEPWMLLRGPAIVPKFQAKQLVSRRTFVFARAGFGKSNLIKLLFSNLYQTTPTVAKRGDREVPVGTVIFDPDGEYFWPDDKNRPGLCDVVALQDQITVFTSREAPTPFYSSFTVAGIKLDIRRLKPADVVSIALAPERQDQQNVRKLKGMNDADWQKLVDLIQRDGNATDPALLRPLLRLDEGQDAELMAARANMTQIVRMLHDPSSQMLDLLIAALRDGKLCVVDVSQMRGAPALILSGLILQRIFDHNQAEFTKAQPETIPTIAVVEEAQSVLGNSGTSGEGPYVTWVKEGRKYDLGAVLVTQQPGSLPHELLSQGDNWFVFHLLSGGDLQAVKRANAHFSDDVLSSLLNEPLVGHGAFWSSAGNRSYPIPLRVLSFEALHKARDTDGTMLPVETYATRLRRRSIEALEAKRKLAATTSVVTTVTPSEELQEGASTTSAEQGTEDVLATYLGAAIAELKREGELARQFEANGVPWMRVQTRLAECLPDVLDDRQDVAFRFMPKVLDDLFGRGLWTKERRPKVTGEGEATWIVPVRQNARDKTSSSGF